MFTPSIMDEAFDIWSRSGIRSLHDLYNKDGFCSFEELLLKFKLHKSHFYRYLQIRNFTASNCSYFPKCPPLTLLDSGFKHEPHSKQIISKIYTLLNAQGPNSLDALKNTWEGDFGEELPEEVWQKIIERIHSSSVCLRHSVIQFKVVHRLHRTKDKLAKIKQDIDPTCDRCRISPATLMHMFWTCPKLYRFWQSIFEAFSVICGNKIKPTPLMSMFGVAP